MASFLRLLPALALPLLGASSAVVGGCDGEDCTALGCLNRLEMVFDEIVPRDYAVTVTIGDRVETADCTAAVEPDTTVEIATNAEAKPGYEETYPNGEDCDEVPCRNASIEIDAHAPSGA